jgi:hypothetical protein
LSQLCEWGATVWVTQFDTGKWDPRAEEAHFMSCNEEYKGFQIYWPKKSVSIKCDVYFDKNQALQPDEVTIEEVEDVFTNFNTSEPSNTSQNIPHTPKPVKNVKHAPSNSPKPKNVKTINSEVTDSECSNFSST